MMQAKLLAYKLTCDYIIAIGSEANTSQCAVT